MVNVSKTLNELINASFQKKISDRDVLDTLKVKLNNAKIEYRLEEAGVKEGFTHYVLYYKNPTDEAATFREIQFSLPVYA